MSGTLFTARIAAAAVLAAIGAAACIGGLGYGLEGEDGTVGTGLLPAATGAVIALLAVVDLVQTLVAARRERTAAVGDDSPADETPVDDDVDVLGRTPKQRNRNLVVVIALVFAAAMLVPLIGLLLSMGLLMIAIAIGVERRKPLPSIAVTVGALACVWLVFAQGLQVPFPTGMLGVV